MHATLPTSEARPVTRRAPWSVAAEAWMVAFGLVHAYWLAGGTAGLPAGRTVFDVPALLVIDVVAIPACAAGAVLARSLRWPADRWPTARWRLRAVAATAAVLALHAMPVVPTWVRLAFPGAPELVGDERFIVLLYEPVFLLGGVLCALAARAARRGQLAATGRGPGG